MFDGPSFILGVVYVSYGLWFRELEFPDLHSFQEFFCDEVVCGF